MHSDSLDNDFIVSYYLCLHTIQYGDVFFLYFFVYSFLVFCCIKLNCNVAVVIYFNSLKRENCFLHSKL